MTDDQTTGAPRLAFVHIDDVKPQEVVAQMHGDRRAGVHIRFLEWSPAHVVARTRYDPGLVLERHGHRSDAFVYILEGLVTIGDRPCPPGTLVVLEKGASFGPLIAGPDGCVFLEWYGEDVAPVSVDKDEYRRVLAERGIVRLPNPEWEPPPGAPEVGFDRSGY